jgi:hypothetical protein
MSDTAGPWYTWPALVASIGAGATILSGLLGIRSGRRQRDTDVTQRAAELDVRRQELASAEIMKVIQDLRDEVGACRVEHEKAAEYRRQSDRRDALRQMQIMVLSRNIQRLRNAMRTAGVVEPALDPMPTKLDESEGAE